MSKVSIVVTSINAPNAALRRIAEAAYAMPAQFLVIGDTKSPAGFAMAGAEFYSYERQLALPFAYARVCPPRHYARKNIGYILAARQGAEVIVETDDDNIPEDGFENPRTPSVAGDPIAAPGWANVYRLFSDANIWPRGLPLTQIQAPAPRTGPGITAFCPIQQGLADDNPDVDAIYRLALPLPIVFARREPVILAPRVWCPFNSQNTTFFRPAFLLTYLPYHCSFRMTDIWRSFVAQRILWTCDWRLMFHSATVRQERNEHDLMKDFEDETPGYLLNEKIRAGLEAVDLAPGEAHIAANLRLCYRKLIDLGAVGAAELDLLDAWIADMQGEGTAP